MFSVSQDDARAAHAIGDPMGLIFSPPFVGLVVLDGDDLAGALVFNNFDRINIDLSCTVLKPWPVWAMRNIASYVFVKLGVKRVTCVTPATHDKAIRSLLRLGFEPEGLMKERFPQGDGLILALLASKQKILRLPNGQHAEPPRSVCDRSSANAK